MSDSTSDPRAAVTQLFINMGAAQLQAEHMAAQLIKRAHQIADERGITLVQATERLLTQVLEARQREDGGI
jgi:hypothetical protein